MNQILFKEKCNVCYEFIEFVEDKEFSSEKYKAYKAAREDVVMCDQGDDRGCFKTYHQSCFDQHRCPVHSGAK